MIPCRPARFDLRAMASTLVAVQATKTPCAVVINAAPHGFRLADEARASLMQTGVTVLPDIVHQYAALSHAVNSGESVHEYEPGGEPAAEIEKIFVAVADFVGLKAPARKRLARSV